MNLFLFIISTILTLGVVVSASLYLVHCVVKPSIKSSRKLLRICWYLAIILLAFAFSLFSLWEGLYLI